LLWKAAAVVAREELLTAKDAKNGREGRKKLKESYLLSFFAAELRERSGTYSGLSTPKFPLR
jgi:hypothetical protein